MRLDSQVSAIEESGSVIAGDSDASELFQRLITDDLDTLMPPPESGRSLSKEQIELIRKWIDQGASWGNHWSLVAPQPTAAPTVEKSWSRNQIDSFIMRRLQKHGLQPSEEADRRTLARRVALDLTGLPPAPDQLAAFLEDKSPLAYERLVDQLIASPQYGEHMARHWLDVVRYGDTHGLHLDNYREHWPYRDWIINAFNQNKPYDEFSIEQLAGDLLEEPSRDQLIATGFNRSHVTTAEGGSIKEEVKVRNVVDRTSTFGTVFLGMTLGCAQCHDHKFDPISQKEFYSLFAYFNSLDGDPMDGNVKDHQPSMLVGSEAELDTLKSLDEQENEVQQVIKTIVEEWKYNEPDDPPAVNPQPVEEIWIDDTLPKSKTSEGAWKTSAAGEPVHLGAVSFVHKATGNQQYFIQNVEKPWEINEQDELFAYVFLDPNDPPREIMLQWNDGNWEHRAIWGENLIEWGPKNSPARLFMGPLPELGKWVRIAVPAAEVNLATGAKVNGVALTQYDGTVRWDAVGKLSHVPPFPANRSLRDWIDESVSTQGKHLPGPLQKIVKTDREKWTEAEHTQLRKHFIRNVYAKARTVIEPKEIQSKSLIKQRDELKAKLPSTLIFRETKQPKEAFVLERGAYDQPKEKVERAVPAAFLPIPESQKNDRLALARWLFNGQHPLTARVTVNRFWQQVFGVGLVETS